MKEDLLRKDRLKKMAEQSESTKKKRKHNLQIIGCWKPKLKERS